MFSIGAYGCSPDWVKEALKSRDTLEYISAVSYQAATYSTELKKLRAGFLIKEMLDRFKNKTVALLKPDRSLWIYSIHSTGMVNILNGLNLFEVILFVQLISSVCSCNSLSNAFQMHIPPLTSNILFELYQRDDEYYVQLFYRKTISENAQPMEIPNCGTKCPLDKFYELYKDILPTEDEDFESLCRSS